jgi:hypothetical protein
MNIPYVVLHALAACPFQDFYLKIIVYISVFIPDLIKMASKMHKDKQPIQIFIILLLTLQSIN